MPSVAPQDCDPVIASKRLLRRFNLVPDETLDFLSSNDDGEFDLDFWRGLLRLLTKHLPYLYDNGLDLGTRIGRVKRITLRDLSTVKLLIRSVEQNLGAEGTKSCRHGVAPIGRSSDSTWWDVVVGFAPCSHM